MKFITQIIFTNYDNMSSFKNSWKNHKTDIANWKQLTNTVFENIKKENEQLLIIDSEADYKELYKNLNRINFKSAAYLIWDDEQAEQQISLIWWHQSKELKAYELVYYNVPEQTELSNSQDEISSLVDDLINDIENLQDENQSLRDVIEELTDLLINGQGE